MVFILNRTYLVRGVNSLNLLCLCQIDISIRVVDAFSVTCLLTNEDWYLIRSVDVSSVLVVGIRLIHVLRKREYLAFWTFVFDLFHVCTLTNYVNYSTGGLMSREPSRLIVSFRGHVLLCWKKKTLLYNCIKTYVVDF